MNERKKTLRIKQADLDKYNKLMQVEELDYEEEDIPRYSCVARWSVDFGDGYEMDLKVCSGDSSEKDPLWCEVVLFLHGYEVACSEVYDELDGVWTLDNKGNCFKLEVLAE